ncbi:MAG: methylated-DNA--[protein]-cysteine S-methyltransferase [Clostridiales bacterium]|nr:methylated-DNA--[protein]-cysteine S-methyltransferase [Clostridiales bacterium]
MVYSSTFLSPIGEIYLTADEVGITGVWLDSCRFLPKELESIEKAETPIISECKRWLDIYFGGKEPNFTPPLNPTGTPFQTEVWKILSAIPYGKTTTYGDIAKELARRRGISKMSAQAVGNAVGRNKISVIIPCHRVIGGSGSLIGYGGGLDKKVYLLKLEGVLSDTQKYESLQGKISERKGYNRGRD